jgi:YtcA family
MNGAAGPQDVAGVSTFSSEKRIDSGKAGTPQMKIESSERNRRQTQELRLLASVIGYLLLAGCSHAPEYSIFGSFFPAWIFCSAGGLVLAAGTRPLIARTAIGEHLAAPVLLYLSIAVFLACVLWLQFYS